MLLRSSNSALLLAGFFLLSTMAAPVAKAQNASSGTSASQPADGAGAKKPKGGAAPDPGKADQGKAASEGCPPTKLAGTSPAGGTPKAGSTSTAKSTAKANDAQPCADAPQPQPKSAAEQFAFPEAISRKAAQAVTGDSSLPDNAAPNAPMPNSPSGPAAGSAGRLPQGPTPGTGAGTAGAPAAGAQGGLMRRSTDPDDPNNPYAGVPVDPSSSSDSTSSSSGSSSSGSSGSGSSNSGSAGSGAPDATVPQRQRLELKDAGSSGQMIDSYRAEKDDDVADFYTKQGNYRGAYLRYQDAVHFNPDDEPAQYGLAEMALKLGNTQEAIDHYHAYLKLAPSGRKAKDAEKALKRLTGSAEKQ